VNLEIEYCFLKATGGRVRTPKASRNPAQQPDFVTALLSFIQARQQPNAPRLNARSPDAVGLERFVRIQEDCDRAFIDQFY
jgi:hypothetical protein